MDSESLDRHIADELARDGFVKLPAGEMEKLKGRADLAGELLEALDWALDMIPDNADLHTQEDREKLRDVADLVAKAHGEAQDG